jgi:hypothetical protein
MREESWNKVQEMSMCVLDFRLDEVQLFLYVQHYMASVETKGVLVTTTFLQQSNFFWKQ